MYADDKPASPITDTGSTRTTTGFIVTESAADAEISPTSTAADTFIAATVLDTTASIGPTTTILNGSHHYACEKR